MAGLAGAAVWQSREAKLQRAMALTNANEALTQKFAADAARKDAEREKGIAEAREREAQQALTQRCARLRDEHRTLVSGARIFSRNAQGERVFLDDATREQRIAGLQQQLRACP